MIWLRQTPASPAARRRSAPSQLRVRATRGPGVTVQYSDERRASV